MVLWCDVSCYPDLYFLRGKQKKAEKERGKVRREERAKANIFDSAKKMLMFPNKGVIGEGGGGSKVASSSRRESEERKTARCTRLFLGASHERRRRKKNEKKKRTKTEEGQEKNRQTDQPTNGEPTDVPLNTNIKNSKTPLHYR